MEATHFIEQFQGNVTKETFTSIILPISMLKTSIEFTELIDNLHTVCIFKIKLKKP